MWDWWQDTHANHKNDRYTLTLDAFWQVKGLGDEISVGATTYIHVSAPYLTYLGHSCKDFPSENA